jgi:hypothetical protein
MSGEFARLFAGHMGVSVVILNALVDKGVISQEELRERFEQARDAAAECSGGPATAQALAEIVRYLDIDSEALHRR